RATRRPTPTGRGRGSWWRTRGRSTDDGPAGDVVEGVVEERCRTASSCPGIDPRTSDGGSERREHTPGSGGGPAHPQPPPPLPPFDDAVGDRGSTPPRRASPTLAPLPPWRHLPAAAATTAASPPGRSPMPSPRPALAALAALALLAPAGSRAQGPPPLRSTVI